LTVEVPANTSAEVWVPRPYEHELARPKRAEFLRTEDGYDVYRVGSGVFEFASATATFASLSQLVTSYTLAGKVALRGAVQLHAKIIASALLELTGHESQAIEQLEAFKILAADTRLVRDATARDTLVSEADALIARLQDSA